MDTPNNDENGAYEDLFKKASEQMQQAATLQQISEAAVIVAAAKWMPIFAFYSSLKAQLPMDLLNNLTIMFAGVVLGATIEEDSGGA